MSGAGEQIDSQVLYEQQKIKRTEVAKKAPAILITDLISSENMGAVYRLADAAGCQTVYVIENQNGQLNQKTIEKVSRHTCKIIETKILTLTELVQNVDRLPLMIAIEITTESTDLFETLLPEDCIFVLGHEKHGVSNEILKLCQSAVHIPMYGINGSMNVTHALAITLFEWRRQHCE